MNEFCEIYTCSQLTEGVQNLSSKYCVEMAMCEV